jgi:hypothetical protein
VWRAIRLAPWVGPAESELEARAKSPRVALDEPTQEVAPEIIIDSFGRSPCTWADVDWG